MKNVQLFLIEQSSHSLPCGAIQSAVVVAESAESARNIHPDKGWGSATEFPIWANTPNEVLVTRLGEADPSLTEGVLIVSLSSTWLDDGK